MQKKIRKFHTKSKLNTRITLLKNIYLKENHPKLLKELKSFSPSLNVTSILYSELREAIVRIKDLDIQQQAKEMLEKRMSKELLDGLYKSQYSWIDDLQIKVNI